MWKANSHQRPADPDLCRYKRPGTVSCEALTPAGINDQEPLATEDGTNGISGDCEEPVPSGPGQPLDTAVTAGNACSNTAIDWAQSSPPQSGHTFLYADELERLLSADLACKT
ncbi:hypothetical protein ACOMHN_005524 [Nucella lapillus]